MIKCEIADDTECQKSICCFTCEDRGDCEGACSFLDELKGYEECEHATEIAEETALAQFNADQKATAIMIQIANIDKRRKALEAQDKEIRKQLADVMAFYGVRNVDNDILKITYVAESVRTSIDSARLKKDLPDIAEKYSKTSKVGASIRITVKE